jgi:hypothetical protein
VSTELGAARRSSSSLSVDAPGTIDDSLRPETDTINSRFEGHTAGGFRMCSVCSHMMYMGTHMRNEYRASKFECVSSVYAKRENPIDHSAPVFRRRILSTVGYSDVFSHHPTSSPGVPFYWWESLVTVP